MRYACSFDLSGAIGEAGKRFARGASFKPLYPGRGRVRERDSRDRAFISGSLRSRGSEIGLQSGPGNEIF